MFKSTIETRQKILAALSQAETSIQNLTRLKSSLYSALKSLPDEVPTVRPVVSDSSTPYGYAPPAMGNVPGSYTPIQVSTGVFKISFASILPNNMGMTLDAIFKAEGWDLQERHEYGSVFYQVYFGKGVSVDGHYEYGFPDSISLDDLLIWAQSFYEFRSSRL